MDTPEHGPHRGRHIHEMPLTMLGAGAEGVVAGVRGGPGFARRLMRLGIHEGVRVRLVANSHGPLIVQVGDGRLALSRGIAHRILITKQA
jgi:ferrous iron transport protein A